MTGNINKRKYFFQKQISLYKSIFSFLLLIGIGTALLSGIYTFFSIKLVSYFMGHDVLWIHPYPSLFYPEYWAVIGSISL